MEVNNWDAREVIVSCIRNQRWRSVLMSCITPATVRIIRADVPKKHRYTYTGIEYITKMLVKGGMLERLPGPRPKYVTTDMGKRFLLKYPAGKLKTAYIIGDDLRARA